MTRDSDKTWHMLFDEICLERGHVDNVKLASALCDLGKNTAPGAFDSALKSLSHWRQGKHTPSRRNFRLLTLILEIDDKSGRAEEWQSLYEQALRRKPNGEGGNSQTIIAENVTSDIQTPKPPFMRRSMRYVAAAAGVVIIAFSALILTDLSAVSGGGTVGVTTLPIDMKNKQISYRQIADLNVGDSIVLHGARSMVCSQQPPEWPEVLKFLPVLSTGVWSDGGVGFRVSRSCGGATPARAVVFTATRSGMDKFMLYEDPITVTVK